MEIRVPSKRIEPFRAPKRHLGEIDAESAAKLLTAAADIALVIDGKGVIRDVAVGSEELLRDGCAAWVGQRWIDTVSEDSRNKIEDLLRDAGNPSVQPWRQVNHPVGRGIDLPVRYSTVQLGSSGKIVALGRDLRGLAVLQQRLVETQQTMEREYTRLRHAETRYRLLFQISSEAVLIVDALSNRIVESNPAASKLLGRASRRLSGRAFPELFDAEGQRKINAFLATLKTSGQAEDIIVRLDDAKVDLMVGASLFRQENAANVLIRLSPTAANATSWMKSRSSLFDVVQRLPDGFVVTDPERRILTANTAFVELTQLATEEQLRGELVDRWVGRHPIDMAVLGKNLKERGEIRNFSTIVRGEYGSSEDVEVSAVAVPGGEQPCLGMTLRRVARRPDTTINGRRALPRSVEQLTELVGRVPLKELVRESTDMIERLCIEAALELTDDNRASAAEMLGLSRQGLYSKLRRHGMGDLDGDRDE
ncbi:MAG: transcriptional regulator PpsR [Hyphomicrobium sp.]|jgi:transcriptional regulator PpsR|nr:transcriptional regulator PpsR [Hyphomicrobium sp.]